MTQKEKQIKIAEMLGKVNIHEEVHTAITYLWCGYEPYREIVPDYFGDLNACAEMESSLTDGQYDTFEQELAKITEFKCHDDLAAPSGLRKVISATAAQRAEAFGLALNLWKV